jgi:hypothetical protein
LPGAVSYYRVHAHRARTRSSMDSKGGDREA